MNMQQFEENKIWINQELAKEYPGVHVFWIGQDPNIEIVDGYEYDIPELISFVQELYRRCGGECEFYPEKMRKI